MSDKITLSVWLGVATIAIGFFCYMIWGVFSPLFVFLLILFLIYPLRENDLANRLMLTVSLIFGLWVIKTLIGILAPFIIGLFLAFLVEPLTERLTRVKLGSKSVSRPIAALVITTALIAILSGSIALILPKLYEQLHALAEKLPYLPEQIQSLIEKPETVALLRELNLDVDAVQSNLFEVLKTHLFDFSRLSTDLFLKIAGSIPQAISVVINIVLIPFLTYYFIADFYLVSQTFNDMLSPKYSSKVQEYLSLASEIFRQYLQGQFIVVTILAVVYSILFWLIGLKYSLLIGVIFGVLAFIPFIGGLISLALAIFAALFGEHIAQTIFFIVVIYAVVHIVENFYLIPKILGSKVKLNPIVLLLSVFVFGFFFNFIGVLFAVPLSAFFVAVYRKEYLEKRQKRMVKPEDQRGSNSDHSQ